MTGVLGAWIHKVLHPFICLEAVKVVALLLVAVTQDVSFLIPVWWRDQSWKEMIPWATVWAWTTYKNCLRSHKLMSLSPAFVQPELNVTLH